MKLSFHAWAWPLGILLLVGAIYVPGLQHALVFDDGFLTDGSLAAYGGGFSELKPRWLAYGSFVWLNDLFGADWWKQRIVNLLLHVAVVAALWAWYRELLGHIEVSQDEVGTPAGKATRYQDSPALWLALGFFALNPVAVYAVAYLVQRSILMATLFVVLALWAVTRGLAGRHWGHYLLAFVCYIAAVLSKEHALMAPLAVLPLYILIRRPPLARLAALGVVAGLAIGLVGTLLWMRYGEIIGKPFDEFSRIYLAQLAAFGPDVERNAYALSIVNQTWLFFKYGLLWVLPYIGWMSIDMRPPFPVSLGQLPQILGVLGYLGVIGLGFYLLIKRRDGLALLGLCLLIPALLFATEFATVWVQDPFVLYRSYLWAVGIPGLVFFIFQGMRTPALLATGLILGGLFVVQGVDRVYTFATPERAWGDAIDKLSDDPRAVGRWRPYLARGHIYLEQGRASYAITDYLAASKLGDMGMGSFDLGVAYALSGKLDEALGAFQSAQAAGYDAPALYYHRGAALHGLKRFAEALEQFDMALKRAPPAPLRLDILAHQGKTALAAGNTETAVAALRQVLHADPKHQEGRLALGYAYIRALRFEEALREFDYLVPLWRDSTVYYGRAVANYYLKRKTAALADIDAALGFGTGNPKIAQLRARILAMP